MTTEGSKVATTDEEALTGRRLKTRTRLVDAAAVVFARQGFVDCKITDITAEAGVANGSFYNYFDSKEAIFRAVIEVVNERMYDRVSVPTTVGGTPYARIEHATRAYVKAYRDEAGLLMILEQVATFSPEFKEMRREVRSRFRERTERGIARMQEAGIADSSLPTRYAADALTSMVSNFCYMWLVFDESYDDEVVIQTLSRMWAGALGIAAD